MLNSRDEKRGLLLLLLFDIIVRSFVRRVLISESIYDTRNMAHCGPRCILFPIGKEKREKIRTFHTHTHTYIYIFRYTPVVAEEKSRACRAQRDASIKEDDDFFLFREDDFDDFDDSKDGGVDDDDVEVESRAGNLRFWTTQKSSLPRVV